MSNRIDPSTVFVIVAAFNENAVLRDVVKELCDQHYKVIVVDDGSDTPVREELKNMPVYILRHEVNLGQGAALQTGIEFALLQDAVYIATFDADGQHQVSDINAMLNTLIDSRADIVLGSRFMGDTVQQIPAGRKIILKTGRWVNYLLTGLLLSDAHNGLRVMTATAASKLHITENRMAHATEFLTLIKKNRLRYKEWPVTIRYTDYSKKKGQSAWNSFRIFFDLLLNKIFR